MFRPFPAVERALFLSRPNRFIVHCEREGGEPIDAYLPNPGRLRELFLPGVELLLFDKGPEASGKTRYTVVGVLRSGTPIMLHTHLTNNAARHLLEEKLVPDLEAYRVVEAEHRVGRSRFDFLLAHEETEEPLLLEVKSCTLFGVDGRVAMFPDAVTARGARHVRELTEMADEGQKTAVLIMVHWPEAQLFSPDFHTDLEFARAFLESRDKVNTIAVSVRWTSNLELDGELQRCDIPWERIEQEAHDRGSYLVLLENDRDRTLEVGALGELDFPRGTYVYVGSAMANLTKRIERHKRLRKRHHWHIDRFRNETTFLEALAIRSSDRLEEELARAIHGLADWSIPGFGASDSALDSHLFGFDADPRPTRAFQDLLLAFRMDRFGRLSLHQM